MLFYRAEYEKSTIIKVLKCVWVYFKILISISSGFDRVCLFFNEIVRKIMPKFNSQEFCLQLERLASWEHPKIPCHMEINNSKLYYSWLADGSWKGAIYLLQSEHKIFNRAWRLHIYAEVWLGTSSASLYFSHFQLSTPFLLW